MIAGAWDARRLAVCKADSVLCSLAAAMLCLLLCSTPKTVLASAGMQADAVTLRKVLAWKIIMYRHKHNKVDKANGKQQARA